MTANDNTGGLNLLAQLLLRPEVRNVWYNAKEVKLDGFKFTSCRFDKCVLVLTSSNFELMNCHIGSDTTIQFGSEIAKPIRLYNHRNEWAYAEAPFFAPVRNPDGTITVQA